MASTRPPRDPIIQDKPGLAGGSVKDASAGRVKSAGAAGPRFTTPRDATASFPIPDSPYGKD
jgi:hypothetical protein